MSSTNKTDRHDITEILLKVELNTIKQTIKQTINYYRVKLVLSDQSSLLNDAVMQVSGNIVSFLYGDNDLSVERGVCSFYFR